MKKKRATLLKNEKMKKILLLTAIFLMCAVSMHAQDVIYKIDGKNVTKEQLASVPGDRIKGIRTVVDSATFKTIVELLTVPDGEQKTNTVAASKALGKAAGNKNIASKTVAASKTSAASKVTISINSNGEQEMKAKVAVGDKAPELIGNNPVTGDAFPSLEGKTVLVNFWATWCGPCVRELKMPEFRELVEKFAADKNFSFVAAGTRSEKAQIVRFVSTVKECEWLQNYILDDSSAALYNQYAEAGVPRTFLIGKDGKILKSYLGVLQETDFKELADAIAADLK